MNAAYNAHTVAKTHLVVDGNWYFVSTITRDSGEQPGDKITETYDSGSH